MLALYETAAGYAVFRVRDAAALARPDDIWRHFETPEAAHRLLRLRGFADPSPSGT